MKIMQTILKNKQNRFSIWQLDLMLQKNKACFHVFLILLKKIRFPLCLIKHIER